jgi:hypothetical protein
MLNIIILTIDRSSKRNVTAMIQRDEEEFWRDGDRETAGQAHIGLGYF